MSPSPATRRLKALGIGIFTGLIVLALAEFVFQFLHLSSLVVSDPGAFIDAQKREAAETPRMIPDPIFGFRPNPEFHEHDSWGYRNVALPEPGAVDIVAIGDSQTYGAGVHRPEAWPQVLAEESGHRVYNLAFGGFGPSHYLLVLRQALALKPKLVIAAFYSGNDLFDTYGQVYGIDYPDTLAPSKDPEVLKRINEKEGEPAIGEMADPLRADRNDKIAFIPPNPTIDWLPKVRLFRLWVKTRGWVQAHWGGEDFCNARLDEIAADRMPFTGDTLLTQRYRYLALDASDPRIQEGLRLTREALALMDRRVREAGARFLVLLIPTKELVYAPVMGEHGSQEPYASLVRDETRLFADLEAFLAAENIPHLFALPALRHALVLNAAPYRRTDDGHPAPAGYRAISHCLAEFIHREGLLAP